MLIDSFPNVHVFQMKLRERLKTPIRKFLEAAGDKMFDRDCVVLLLTLSVYLGVLGQLSFVS